MVYWILSFALGGCGVLQAGLNRQIGKQWGLSTAIVVNAGILMIVATAFWILCRRFPSSFPENFHSRIEGSVPKWWFCVPAVCGFALVAGLPSLIPKLGATGVFLGMVVGQMCFSLLWDRWVEGAAVDPRRVVGAALAMAGLVIGSWGRI